MLKETAFNRLPINEQKRLVREGKDKRREKNMEMEGLYMILQRYGLTNQRDLVVRLEGQKTVTD